MATDNPNPQQQEGDTRVPCGRYRHYKGNEYTVLGLARHSETEEELVVYRQEYGEHGLWVRPRQMFQETVTVEGKVSPRFRYLGEHPSRVFDYRPVDQALSYWNERAFFPRSAEVPATLSVRAGNHVLGCHVVRHHPDAGWVVYFHGNGELAAECVEDCGDLFTAAGVNVCFVEYRGYGTSEGEPALAAMLDDGEQVVHALGVPAHRVAAFGRSLGSLYAIELAHRMPQLAGLILESGIASLNDIWPLPDHGTAVVDNATAAWATHFDHQAKLSHYTGPLLVLHAAGDQLVPPSHAKRLHQWAGGTLKRLAILPQGNHNTILRANIPLYVAELERFIQRTGMGTPERNRSE